MKLTLKKNNQNFKIIFMNLHRLNKENQRILIKKLRQVLINRNQLINRNKVSKKNNM